MWGTRSKSIAASFDTIPCSDGVQRLRSVSMNGQMGVATDRYLLGRSGRPLFIFPIWIGARWGPRSAWYFADENFWSMNDEVHGDEVEFARLSGCAVPRITAGGSGSAFADGHAEYKKMVVAG